MTCLVTFSAATSGGAMRANAKLVFVATGPAIRAAGGTVVPRDAIEALADASGVGSVALRPGPYVLQMVTPLGLQAVEITVPAEETADLWTLVDAVDIPLPPESLQLAQASAVLAASERTQAAQERAAAELARLGAEGARDASFSNATVYLDIPTGRAAVADGEQFTVVPTGATEAVRYRRDSSSTQTEIARYPTAARVSEVRDSGVLGTTINLGRPTGTGDAIIATIPAAQAHIPLQFGTRVRWQQPANSTIANPRLIINGQDFELRPRQSQSFQPGALAVSYVYEALIFEVSGTLYARVQNVTGIPDVPSLGRTLTNFSPWFASSAADINIDFTAAQIVTGAQTFAASGGDRLVIQPQTVSFASASTAKLLLVKAHPTTGALSVVENDGDFRGHITVAIIRRNTASVLMLGGYSINGVAQGDRSPPMGHWAADRINRIRVNFDTGVLQTSALTTALVGRNSVTVAAQTVNFSATNPDQPAIVTVNPDTGALAVTEFPGTLPANSIVLGSLMRSRGEVNGFVCETAGVSVAAKPAGLHTGAGASINFDLGANQIIIGSGATVVVGSTRYTLTAQTVDFSAIPRNNQALLYLDATTGIVSVVRQGDSPFRHDRVLLGGFNRFPLRVFGLSDYAVHGRPAAQLAQTEGRRACLGWDITAEWTCPALPSYRPTDAQDMNALTTAIVHGWYDALMAAHPAYITREILGTEPGSGLELRAYRFRPPLAPTPMEQPSGSFNDPDVGPVRIMLQSGIHPEYMSLLDVYHLMDQVCNNWASSPFLEALRWGCDILVMPVISPWSINNNSRTNSNGVNINRNYAQEWVQGDVGINWGGSGPLSEIEAQVSYAQMQSHRPLIFADVHNFEDVETGRYLWVLSSESTCLAVGAGMINRMSRKWQAENAWMPDAAALGYVSHGALGCTYSAARALGAHACVFETAHRLANEPGSVRGSALAVRYATEALGNWLRLMLIKVAT